MAYYRTYYAYILLDEDKRGICDSWKDCEKIVKGKNARYKKFKTKEEAKAWLDSGAEYEKKENTKEKKRPAEKTEQKILPGIYFDAGTGRGQGVEIALRDENGKDLLTEIISNEMISVHGTHLIPGVATNNYGELLSCKFALQLALKKGIMKVFGDSELVIKYWSKGTANIKDKKTLHLMAEVVKLRNEFEQAGGRLVHISGDINPADLGFHRKKYK